jgi:hypothetical protein
MGEELHQDPRSIALWLDRLVLQAESGLDIRCGGECSTLAESTAGQCICNAPGTVLVEWTASSGDGHGRGGAGLPTAQGEGRRRTCHGCMVRLWCVGAVLGAEAARGLDPLARLFKDGIRELSGSACCEAAA